MNDTDYAEEQATTSVEIEATPDQIWHALTTTEGLASWMGDGSSMGDQPGDDLVLDDPVTGEPKRGRVEEAVPGKHLRYQWWPEVDPERSTRVAITLEPCEAGTRVTVVESRPVPLMAARAQLRAPSAVATCADWQWRSALLAFTMSRHTTLALSASW